MNWWQWTLVGVAGTVGLAFLCGSLLPREHEATCTARFRAKAQDLYDAVKDVGSASGWRKELSKVEILAPVDGKASWAETSSWGKVTYVLESDEPGRRLVYRIADESLPYGGTWTFRFAPEGDGTKVSITESGFVKPALFRLLARFVFGYHKTLHTYVESLSAKFGENVTIEHS